MRVAFVLVVALLFVALASAGSGKAKKHRGGKEHKKVESWEGKKNIKNKKENGKWETKEKEIKNDKKRNKREASVEPKEEQKRRNKEQEKMNIKEKSSEQEDPIQETSQPLKKKSKKIENVPKKDDWKMSKSKSQGHTKEKKTRKEEPEDVIIETVEEIPSEDTDGECDEASEVCSQDEPADDCIQDQPEVTLSSGAKVKGAKGKTHGGRDTAEFTGVPYAESPQGQERFKEAVLMDYWAGVYKATSPGNDCLQLSHFTYSVIGSENCLYLNVYTPKLPKHYMEMARTDLLPVVVYFHGGAFMFFSSAIAGPKYLLDTDVVLVTVNYRLGPLGFFSLGDDSVPGNLGLRDQTTALKWVQKNIRSFGGDSERVTIAGMSAGGASVHYHLLSPLSKGLFSQAISVSGSALNPWSEAENVVEKSLHIARELGCQSGTNQEIVECLKTRPAEKIVAISKNFQVWLYVPFSPWAPSPEPKTASNPFLPDSPANIIRQGKTFDVPWLISFTSQEGGYPGAEFLFNSTLLNYLDQNWLKTLPHLLEYNYIAPPERLDDISRRIKHFYLKEKTFSDPESRQAIVDMMSDRLFLHGIAQTINLHGNLSSSSIFTYRFTHVGQDSVSKTMCHCQEKLAGACHADDLGYILEALTPVIETPNDIKISKRMVGMWYSFISTGIPIYNHQPLPRINDFKNMIPFLDIIQDGEFRMETSFDLGNQKFWSSLGLSDVNTKSIPAKDEL